ncbi:uncharacterized protein LOC113130155 [Mastacembelus armatus]|uniref:uncharacterized protein LOC113130155 n=1 Tax=Mastacembelus armatus TaxID=205130 RepID=UPI000E45FD9B|nr:uncharacterized protein LOC113130155 [Mastacembelus armatus]
MSRQSSPAEVEVTCFYLDIYQSPQSNMASITIGIVPPSKLAVSPLVIRETDSVTVNCQTPSSVSQCYFYIGRENPAKRFSCLQTLTGTELLLMSGRSSPAEVEVTCFYLDIYQSPQSNMASITIEKSVTEVTIKASTGTLATAYKTTPPEMHIQKLLVLATGVGVTVGVVLLGMGLFCTKRGSENHFYKRSQASVADEFRSMRTSAQAESSPDEGYNFISYVPGADCPTGSEKLNRQASQKEDSDVYHLYATIAEEPAAAAMTDMLYNTMQAH